MSEEIDWKSRAEAAEDEVERLTKRTGELEHVESLYKSDLLALDFIRTNDVPAKFLGKPIVAYAAHLIVESRARIAELEAEVAILKDVRATEQYLASLPVGDKELDFAKRTATEAALRHIAKTVMGYKDDYVTDHWVKRHLSAVCGEVKP